MKNQRKIAKRWRGQSDQQGENGGGVLKRRVLASIGAFSLMVLVTPLFAQTVINQYYVDQQGGRTIGSMNKCVKAGVAPLYTDGTCPEGYQLEDRQWQDEANLSYKENPETRAARLAEEREKEEARKRAAAGPEVKEGDLQRDLFGLGAILGVMGADESAQESSEMQGLFEKSAQHFLPDGVDARDINYQDAFEYGLKRLFNPDAIIDEALGEGEGD